ncbi:tripartite tricarboxylate transporter substrate binding protein [Bordetella sp. LUAb4]|uniref:Bug family tripartite tricarboxylate transporter substrate binding protein n=1 Tax=Bordetella sp. LUAb4 TaxID=2843195 RepID=UPI001E644EE7|nr:tripartite tricarboxylate transporter substrate binding protein [Bordetella sp. LUAb4]
MGLRRNGVGLVVVAGCAFPLAAMPFDRVIEVFPKRPITLVVGYPPGDSPDLIARELAVMMGEELGQKVIISNRPGAVGNIAAAAVAKSDPDGYTVYLATRAVALHKAMFKQIKFDFAKDLAPIGMVVRIPFVLVAGKHVPATTFQEAITLVSANPGKYTCASGGLGATSHLICEALKDQAGLPWTHIPYSGSVAALVDLLGGRADFTIAAVSAALPHIAAGSLRPLVAFSDGRIPAIEGVPNIEELGFEDISAQGWCALMAPTGTPLHAITRLNRSLNIALSSEDVRRKLVAHGYVLPSPANTPEALDMFLMKDTAEWSEVLQQRQIQGLQ